MYLDEKREWRPPEPAGAGRRLTDRYEKLLLWAIGAFVLSLVVAPIGGASVIQAIMALLG